jgi:hypothetical protein
MADTDEVSKNDQPAEQPAEINEPEAEAVEPESSTPESEVQGDAGESKFKQKFHQLKAWYRKHLLIAIPLTILMALLIIVIIPFLRYAFFGLFYEQNYSIAVVDSQTKGPVSGATVTAGSVSGQTDGSGKATLKTKPGHHAVQITKKYYKDSQLNVTLPVLKQKSVPQTTLVATGRQVKITVVNTINKKPVSEASIKVADITAKTDSAGNTLLVLPPGVPEQHGILSANGYNDTDVTVKVSDTEVAQNNFKITSAGKIYFLSKRTGKIDVMKSNLDGTDQKVVLAGTGTESDTDTILLASRDWKYLALKSKRDNSPAKLYYIDTSVDKLNTLDEGNADFQLVGWAGDTFVYQVNRNGMSQWQVGLFAIKSFNATNSKLTLLDQSSAAGTDSNHYAHENYIQKYIIDNTLVFEKNWTNNNGADLLNGKQAGIYSVNVDGSGPKTVKGFSYDQNASFINITSTLYKPKTVYYEVSNGDNYSYFKYETGNLTADNNLKDSFYAFLNSGYSTYLTSPSAKQTFWTEARDGKSSFLLGDPNAGGEKEVALLNSKYSNYGYYSDDYLLVSKDSDEIFVMPSVGVKAEADLIKITDYHKPAYIFYGYGGGYGGL